MRMVSRYRPVYALAGILDIKAFPATTRKLVRLITNRSDVRHEVVIPSHCGVANPMMRGGAKTAREEHV